MRISLVGIDHQTALVTLREKVAIIPRKLYETLPLLRSNTSRGVILSTCNRTEIYMLDKDVCRAEQTSLDFLKERLDIPHSRLLQCVYTLKDREAVEHLFRVSSGLESMIVGEFEVLGQVGHALEVAEEAGMVDLPLRHIFQSAIRTGRRVRKETGISRNALSVSSVAVDLASRVVGKLKNCQVLVIGAGEAGRLVAKAAKGRGVSGISFAGRTEERALSLAKELGGSPVSPANLEEALSKSNIVVTCAGAPHRILSIGQVKRSIEKRPETPMVIIDIATPRNVDPAVSQVKNVVLYNIDDLTELSDLNRKQREKEVREASRIIADEMDKFASWWRAFEVRSLVSAITGKAETVRKAQLNQTLTKLRSLSDEEQDYLDAMTKSIVNKILKDPLFYLKANGHNSHTDIVRELFRLDEDK